MSANSGIGDLRPCGPAGRRGPVSASSSLAAAVSRIARSRRFRSVMSTAMSPAPSDRPSTLRTGYRATSQCRSVPSARPGAEQLGAVAASVGAGRAQHVGERGDELGRPARPTWAAGVRPVTSANTAFTRTNRSSWSTNANPNDACSSSESSRATVSSSRSRAERIATSTSVSSVTSIVTPDPVGAR